MFPSAAEGNRRWRRESNRSKCTRAAVWRICSIRPASYLFYSFTRQSAAHCGISLQKIGDAE